MKVLVTGGAGFIGSHIVDHLLETGVDVRVLDRLHPAAHSDRPDYLDPRSEVVFGSICDENTVEQAVTGVDAVFHQAAMVGLGRSFSDAPLYARDNDLGTAILLAALHRTDFRGKLILASSMVVYGEGRYACSDHGRVRPAPRDRNRLSRGSFEPTCLQCGGELSPAAVTEDQAPDPRSVYAATKLHQEHLCFAFGRESEVPVIALRYHNVYGPRMPQDTPYAGVASIFRSALAKGQAPKVFEDGEQLRDYVHVDDVARANVRALGAPREVEGAFNIASGEVRSVGDMARRLSTVLGGREPIVTGEYRLGDVRHVFASPKLAADRLGFTARVRFDDGMRSFATDPLRPPAQPAAAVLG